jgi:hypothetical protein
MSATSSNVSPRPAIAATWASDGDARVDGIGDMKGCLARVDSLPAEHVEAVRGGNAQRIFGL